MQTEKSALQVVYQGWLTVLSDPDHRHEVVRTTDSVAFLVYVEDWGSIILLEQSREPMKSDDNPQGLIVEVPAGRFDVELSVRELIAKEAKEELGADVHPLMDVYIINSNTPVATSPGVLTERQHLAYVLIQSSQLESEERIFGVPGEEVIKRLRIPVKQLRDVVFQDLKTFALVQWFLNHLRSDGRIQ